jgi:hypothetical protein
VPLLNVLLPAVMVPRILAAYPVKSGSPSAFVVRSAATGVVPEK